jgi:hypothetical protein
MFLSIMYIGRELCLYFRADIRFRASPGERYLGKVAKTRGATGFNSDDTEPFSGIEDDSPNEERGRKKFKKGSVLFLVLTLFVLTVTPVTLRRLTPEKPKKWLLARLGKQPLVRPRKQPLSVFRPKARILISRTMSPGLSVRCIVVAGAYVHFSRSEQPPSDDESDVGNRDRHLKRTYEGLVNVRYVMFSRK